GDAAGEVETRRRERHLRHQDWVVKVPATVETWPHDIKQVIVHADDAGNHRASVKIENRGVLVGRDIGALIDSRDLSVLDHNILVFDRRPARTVNDSHVGEDNLPGTRTDELLHCLRELRTLGVDIERSQQQHEDPRQKAQWHRRPPERETLYVSEDSTA